MNPNAPAHDGSPPPLGSASSELEAILQELAGTLLSGGPQSPLRLPTVQGVKPSGSQREVELQMEAARYRTLVELLPAITFLAVFEQGLNEVYVSPQIETIFGYSQREWVEDPVLWYERLHPEDRERWNKEFAETVARGRPLSSAYRFLARDGRVVWLHSEVRVARGENGEPSFIHGVGFDITQSKEAERLASVARELARSNADLDQFAYIASHDLREPLRTVATYTQRLHRMFAGRLDEAASDCIARVINGARLMDRLIDDLYTYSRVGREGERKLINCAALFSAVCANLETAMEEAGAAVTADPLPAVMGVETELLRLFQNLIGNGVKFRGDRPVRVHVGAVRQGRYWQFSVRDNGIGIQRQFWKRIFGIGERLHTKTKYPGTGFGLAICQKIVEHHGGQIWLESEPGAGSTFFFTVPAT